jgi:hypothetical protein
VCGHPISEGFSDGDLPTFYIQCRKDFVLSVRFLILCAWPNPDIYIVTVVATSPLYERNAINIAISSTDASQILQNL